MVIYGIMTETSIGKLFVAGIIPGLIATVLLCLAVVVDHLARSRRRPAGRAALLAGAPRGAQARLAGRRVVRAGHRRHLRRRVHRHRGRRHRRRRRVPVRAGAPGADLEDADRRPDRKRAHHLDAVHDPDRRAAVRQLRELHDHAGRPEGLRHPVQRPPDAGDRRHLPDLRRARHGHGGAFDDPPDRAAVLSGRHRRSATTRSGSASWW